MIHNHSLMFFKIGVLKKIRNIHKKTPATLFKRNSNTCFPLNIAKFLKTPFYRTSPVTASNDGKGY